MRTFLIIVALALAFLLPASSASAATTIPFEFRDDMIWLKVDVAGQGAPLNFLLDSGAGKSVLDLAAARRLGVALGARQAVQGVYSHSAGYAIKDFAGRIGDTAVPRTLLALDLSRPSAGCHRQIDGLLGLDFFREHIVQINFCAGTIRLLSRDEANPVAGEILPLTIRNDALCVKISVDGNRAEWFRLDTGCNTPLEWVVAQGKARSLRQTTIGLNSGSIPEIHTEVKLGTRHISAVRTGVHTTEMFAGESGLVGNGLLSRFTVTIDAGRKLCALAGR